MLALPGSSDFFSLPLSARKPALFSLSAPSLEHCFFLSFFCLCLLSPGSPLSHHTVLPSYLAFLTWSSSLACWHFLISYRLPLILSDFFKVISYSFSNFFPWLLKMSSNNQSKLVGVLCNLACFLPFLFCLLTCWSYSEKPSDHPICSAERQCHLDIYSYWGRLR